MNKNLFEIHEDMMNLLEYGVDEDGCIVETEEEFNALYEQIQIDLQTKLDNTICLSKLIDGEIEVIDKEIKRLQSEKKSRENKRKWLLGRVDNYVRMQFYNEDGTIDLVGLNKYKLDLPHSKIAYRKSESVEVQDINLLPKEFIKIKTEESADKTSIKKAIKEGNNIKGAKLVTNVNLNVK